MKRGMDMVIFDLGHSGYSGDPHKDWSRMVPTCVPTFGRLGTSCPATNPDCPDLLNSTRDTFASIGTALSRVSRLSRLQKVKGWREHAPKWAEGNFCGKAQTKDFARAPSCARSTQHSER